VKKKVAIIIERADIRLGGAERSVFELADALSELELDVGILAATAASGTKNVHALCHNVGGKRTSYRTFERILKDHLEQNQYDIVHSVLPFDFADVYQPRGGAYAEAVQRNAASYQNKFIGLCKTLTAFGNFRRSSLLRAEKKLCKNPNGPVVAALSDYVAQQFRSHYGLDGNRIVVIPNGVRTDRQIDTEQTTKLKSDILRQLAIGESDNPVFFLFVANNFRLKGLKPLLAAFHAVVIANADSPAYLVVAGNDSTRAYKRMAAKLNILNRIVFLGALGRVDDVLAATDVAILPTYYDPSSRFILEALSAHKPVITTEFNGATDLFSDGRHAIVIDAPENIQALASAIEYFTDRANIQQASTAIADDKLEEKISIKRVAEQLMSLYMSILSERGQK